MSDDSKRKPVSEQIDKICDRFEADWNAGGSTRIEDYLSQVAETDQEILFYELLALELEFRLDNQEQPTAEEYEKRFPAYAERIESAFADSSIHQICDQTIDSDNRPPRALHIRCPHCHNPIQLVDDTPLAEITCGSCGSNFNLVGDEALAFQTHGGTVRRRRTIGHFELTEQLGSGAYGTVWKANDTKLDRTVAVKIPRKGQLDQEETEKFLREAPLCANMSETTAS